MNVELDTDFPVIFFIVMLASLLFLGIIYGAPTILLLLILIPLILDAVYFAWGIKNA